MNWKEKIILMLVSVVLALILFLLANNPRTYDKNDEECSDRCGNADYGYLAGNYKFIEGKLVCTCKTYGIP